MASVLAAVPMVTGFPQITSGAAPHPVKSQARHVGFVKASVAALQAAGNSQPTVGAPGASDPVNTARAAVTPVQDVAGAVTVVGVTWPKGATSDKDTYQIRTMTGATWSQWQSMTVIDGGPGSGPSATTGTDPYIVIGASKYEVRSLTTEVTAPTAATVQAVDPGTSNADVVQQAPGAAAAATTKPAIHTRAQWGADESKMTWAPSYGKVSVGFVHHTDGSNNYAAGDVAGIVRGIYAYHAVSLGWGDIGYNFLVDRFGGIWEGRAGGMDKPVIGGQVYNYNAVSTGVSGIGDFTSAAVPQAMTDAFKRVLGWRLSVAGIPATGASPVQAPGGAYIQRISGHRDVGGTACPGNSLYARLGEIRAGAAAIIGAQKPVTPANRTPIGNPGGATSTSPGMIAVGGWALDPDTTSSIRVHVYVDGHATLNLAATGPRPDVGRVVGKGDNHGFSATLGAVPGTHQVCVYAINTPVGSNPSIGCRNVTVPNQVPVGSLESVASGMDSFTVSGWALDPDTTSSIRVHVYVDGRATLSLAAAGPRPDVGRIFGKGDNHGFTATLNAAAGPHQVCIYAINTPAATNHRIGCRNVVVSNQAPFGAVDSVTSGIHSFTVRGWALDPDTTSSISVHVYVDGRYTLSLAAAGSRPDVGRVFGKGDNHGFSATLNAAPGPHQVCVYAIRHPRRDKSPLRMQERDRAQVGGLDRSEVDRPTQRAQRRDQGLNCRRQHGELGKAERLAHGVIQVQVLHVDPGLADVVQQPTQRTRLIRNDDDDRGVGRRGRAMLARNEGVPRVAVCNSSGQDRPGAHAALVRVRLQVTQRHQHGVKLCGERLQDAADCRCIAGQDLGPHARVAGRDACDVADSLPRQGNCARWQVAQPARHQACGDLRNV